MTPTGWMRWLALWGIALPGSFQPKPVHATDAEPPTIYDAEIRLLGAVHHPGWYPIAGNSTSAEVIRRAGGLTSDAAQVMVVVRKNRKKGFIVFLHDPSFHLQPDDELRVLRTRLK